MLQIFGFKEEHPHGVTCGIVIAESKEEAEKIINDEVMDLDVIDKDNVEVTLTPIELKKGYTFIGKYDE